MDTSFINEDTIHGPSYIEMCTKQPLKWGHPSNQDTSCGPKGVCNIEVPLYFFFSLGRFVKLNDGMDCSVQN